MDTHKEFEILIRRRMPFISSFLSGVMIFLLVYLFLFYVVMYPAIHSRSSSEMMTAYYILVVPNTLKTLSAYSFFGLLIVIPLYYKVRLHKPAILIFERNRLVITGKKINIDIPLTKIEKVYCNDLKNIFREPKGKLQIVVQQKRRKQTAFRLKYYEQGEEFIDMLSTLQGVTLASYDDEIISEHDNE